MSEENNKENIVDELAPVPDQTSNRKPLYIAGAAIGVVVVGALLFWFLRGKQEGNIVPAPRTVSFGDNTCRD